MDSKKLDKIVKYARLINAERFLLLGREGQMTSMHIQKMNPRDALNAVIAAFAQLIGMDLEGHVYPKEYVEKAGALVADFQALVKKYNSELADILAKQPKP